MSESTAERNSFEMLAEEFSERLRRGEHPSLTEYVERYPEHADDIRDLFPALVMVEQFKPAPQEANGASPGAFPSGRGNITEQLGDYRILRYLGEGGMGVVYEAVRESLRNHVALKVMHAQYRKRPDYLRRFHKEARSAARLHHTNIVSVFDYGEHDGVCYYAMQYIAGQSLDKVLDDIRQLRVENEEVPVGETVSLTCHADNRDEHEDVGREDKAQCATKSLRGAITLGLLTGQFAPAGADGTSGEQDTPPPSELAVASVEDPADMGTATRRFASQLRQAAAKTGPSRERPPASGAAADSAIIPPDDKSSALAGKADIRYYREVARLGAQVADALAHAHGRNVLHRDIKLPNLILDPLGNIWVTDFGLAKFEKGDDLSQSQGVVGTLRYIPPERFLGISDRRGDIYALGAALYEMLTFRPPFDGQDQLDLIRRIENEPPRPLREIDHRIPRDLETIVLISLAKDPGDRFASAEEMAKELRRFVDNRPIHSRPIPYYQQFWRWCKRNPWLATANVTAAALTTILAIVSTVAALTYHNHLVALRIERGKTEGALQAKADAERQTQLNALEAFHSKRYEAMAGRYSHQMGQRFAGLDALGKAAKIAKDLKLPRERFDALRDEAIACLALPDLRRTGRDIPFPRGAFQFAFDSTISRYALRFRDGTIQVRRIADDQQINSFQARGARDIGVFCLSPDGRYLATTHSPGGALTVWDVDRGTVVLNDPRPITFGRAAKFSPDSRRIVIGYQGDSNLVVYDLVTSRPDRSLRMPAPPGELVFRADGAQIAVLLDDEQKKPVCRIIEVETGRIVRSFQVSIGGNIALSPDGATLALSGGDSKIYLWDTVTGSRKPTLEGSTNSGIHTAFHPAGTLLASCGYEGRLRLWDPVLGRPWLSVSSGSTSLAFSQDGRIVLQSEDKLTIYQVDPALEYRTFAHASSQPIDYARLSTQPINYARPSIRHDGRLLAVGTNQGVTIWDLARGTELAFLPIGLAWHTTFEPSGNLLTSGSTGVWRWPVQVGADRNEFHIGPPQQLPLPGSDCGIAQDRSGKIIALANHSEVRVITPDRQFQVGPLDDCRGVAVSPDGEWLATGNHQVGGARVSRIREAAEVAKLPIDGGVSVIFSPDGKWLMTRASSRLWTVGTWREALQIGGTGLCFSPDGRLVVVMDPSRVLRLVEIGTNRTLARLESPDLCGPSAVTFSPDGSRLVLTTNEPGAVHVWDLRAIRKDLTEMGLDWDAPAYPDDAPAGPSALPLPRLQVDYGPLRATIEQTNVSAEDLVARYTERLKARPGDPESLHQRGHVLLNLRRFDQALADFSAASAMRPLDGHLRAYRGICLFNLKRYAPALDQLESAFQTDPKTVRAIFNLDQVVNNLAWVLATGPKRQRDPKLAARLAAFAVALAPGKETNLNTLGVALYRVGKFADAITTLEKSLGAGKGQFDAFDLFVLAMAHHRLGHRPEALACYDRAVRWVADQKTLPAQYANELAAFRAEAEAVLASEPDDLPAENIRTWIAQTERRLAPIARSRSGIPNTEWLAGREWTCGVHAIDLTTGQVVQILWFETAVQEVITVPMLPRPRFPELINDDSLLENSFVVPDAALADVSAALRARPTRPVARRGREGTGECRASVRESVREFVHQSRKINNKGETQR